MFSKFLLVPLKIAWCMPRIGTDCLPVVSNYTTLKRQTIAGSGAKLVWRRCRGARIQWRGGWFKGHRRGWPERCHLSPIHLVPRRLHWTPWLSRKCQLLFILLLFPPTRINVDHWICLSWPGFRSIFVQCLHCRCPTKLTPNGICCVVFVYLNCLRSYVTYCDTQDEYIWPGQVS